METTPANWIAEERTIVAHDGQRIVVRAYRLGIDGSIQFRTSAHTDRQSSGYSAGGWHWAEPSAYRPCACRDCMETAIGLPGAFCGDCEGAGCEPGKECQAPGAYGSED